MGTDARSASPATRRGLAAVGLVVGLIGCTMPWYSVGPATTLGVATWGRWPLAAIVVAAIALTIDRFRPDRRLVVAAEALLGIAVITTVIAVFRTPTSMSVSVGPITTLIGTALAMWATSRPSDQPADDIAAPDDAADGVADDRSTSGRVIRAGGLVAGGLIAVVLVLGFWPVSISGLGADPDPTTTFDDAVARFDDVAASETDVYPPCRSRLLHHDAPTEVVVVLFHGLTNCPRQYVELATEMHDQGATVLITRAPGHGIGDDEALAGAGALRDLDAPRLTEYADRSVDIATGLGDEVRVSGLSMGGVVALWVAQHRPDVDEVVAVAPAMELPVVPNVVSTFFTNLFLRVPTITRSHERHIDHDYAALSTRGLAATFALGQAVADEGLATPAVVDDLVVMLNPDDPLVPEDDVATLMRAWQVAGTDLRVTEFDAIGLPHDLIDVGQPKADPDHVYPLVLTELGFADTWSDEQG